MSLKKVDKYYMNKDLIEPIIQNQIIKNKGIVFGQKATNYHLPQHLDRHTEDYDIYSKNPKKSAIELEKKLDKRFGGDFFNVKRALHKGTYKVKSNISKKTIADFTKKPRKIPHTKAIDNIKYAKLNHLEKKLKGILKDKSKSFRHKKDRDMLNRINVAKKYYE